MSTASTAQQVSEYFTGLQQRIVERLEEVDGKPFRRDQWERARRRRRPERVIEDGKVFERGGVNFSHVTAAACRLRHRCPARTLGARRWRRWACRSCCIRATRMRRPCT